MNFNDDEIRPLLGRQDRSYSSGGQSPAPGEYKSTREQRLAIAGLLLSQFVRVIAFQLIVTWIPYFASLTMDKETYADSR